MTSGDTYQHAGAVTRRNEKMTEKKQRKNHEKAMLRRGEAGGGGFPYGINLYHPPASPVIENALVGHDERRWLMERSWIAHGLFMVRPSGGR